MPKKYADSRASHVHGIERYKPPKLATVNRAALNLTFRCRTGSRLA